MPPSGTARGRGEQRHERPRDHPARAGRRRPRGGRPDEYLFCNCGRGAARGRHPRLADVSPATFALSPDTLQTALTPQTAAVVLVHIGGLITPEVDAIRSLCDRHGVALVEDAAHAHGASFEGRSAGSFGHAAAFSFYPTKVMTSGEGGMITTRDDRVRDEAVLHRDQGKDGFVGGDHVRWGYAWRMSELHAAVGLVHLGRLDDAIADAPTGGCPLHRGALGGRVLPAARRAGRFGVQLLQVRGASGPAHRPFRAQADSGRAGRNLAVGRGLAVPLHRQPVLAGSGGEFPVADDVCARHICLPVHSDMTDSEVEYVVENLISALEKRVAS